MEEREKKLRRVALKCGDLPISAMYLSVTGIKFKL
jgi:hypothetical protein